MGKSDRCRSVAAATILTEELDADRVLDHLVWLLHAPEADAGPRGIAYAEVNIDEDSRAAEMVMRVNGGNPTVPTVVFPDGVALTNPSIDQVKAALAA